MKPLSALLITVLAWFAVARPGFASADQTSAAEQLDQIVMTAGSLESFINDRSALDRYYAILREYYGAQDHSGGEKFPRAGFDSIVRLLRRTLRAHPEMAAELNTRLLDDTGLGKPFSLDVREGGHGVQLDPRAWSQAIDEWRHALLAKAGVAGADQDATELRDDLAAIAPGVNLFVAAKALPSLQRLASRLLLTYLDQPAVTTKLEPRNADAALQLLRTLRTRPHAISQAFPQFNDLDPYLRAEIRALVPREQELEQKPGMKSPVTIVSNQGARIPLGALPTGKYEFVPLRRRIHGLWKGVVFKECIGGSCAPGKRPHLERVFTVLLQGTQLHHLEINGRYRGFIQAVPVSYRGVTYGSVDFSAYPIRNYVTVSDAETGEPRTAPLFELWLEQAMRDKPSAWRGFVVGTGRVSNNANVLDAIHSSPQFVFGLPAGRADDFHTGDPWQDLLPDLQSRHGDARDIGGRMVFDAAMAGQKELTQLTEIPDLRVQGLVNNADFVADFFATVTNVARRAGLATLIAAHHVDDPTIQLILVREFLRDRKARVDTWGDVLLRDELEKSLKRLPIEDPAVITALLDGLRRNLDRDLARRVQSILAQIGIAKITSDPRSENRLAALAAHPDSVVRARACAIALNGGAP